MNQLNTLGELEQDAITEVFNIGIGKAAAALCEMLSKEISLSVPTLSITTLSKANEKITAGDENVIGVKECFDGAIAGNAILLFPQHRSLDLVRLLFPPGIDDETLIEMEDDTLTEIGNIILNATLSALSDILGEELCNQVPESIKGSIKEIVYCNEVTGEIDPHILQVDMDMTVTDIDIQGDISFLLIIKSIDDFKTKLAGYFGLN